MKKLVSILLAVLMLAGMLTGCGQQAAGTAPASSAAEAEPAGTVSEPAMREFTDDCGRTVTIPSDVKSVAVTGPLTQIYMVSIGSDIMAGSSNSYSEDAEKYLPERLFTIPELGQLYGGKGTMDLEALLAANPDFIVDVGEPKGSMAEDLDGLSEQTGIPFVHIDATMLTAPAAYRRLGELLGMQDKAEEVAVYLEGALAEVDEIMQKVDADGARKKLVYCLGDKGLNVLAEASFHAETLKLVADNVAVLDDVVSSGAGNEVDMEQLMIWNPDVIIFAPDSVYSQVGDDPTWQQLDAIKNGEFFATPTGPYGWLQSPPSVQRYLGMLWLCSLLYPDYCSYDLQETVTEYYSIFYGHELTAEEYSLLTADSLR